jgi:glycosyltransferase involved in cell wall biosynthesis
VDSAANAMWYSRAKLYVSIPESDGAPISLLEAMRCGAVPVVADLPANREWISDGSNGLLVNDFNRPFLEEALQLNREQVAKINKNLIDEKADAAVCRKNFISLYETLLVR